MILLRCRACPDDVLDRVSASDACPARIVIETASGGRGVGEIADAKPAGLGDVKVDVSAGAPGRTDLQRAALPTAALVDASIAVVIERVADFGRILHAGIFDG